jgi:hypothetical protein
MRSRSRHLHSHIPRVIIHPRPWGSIFLTSRPGTHAHVQNYRITIICSLSLDIVHVGYSVFMCEGTWSSHTIAAPQVYYQYWHVIIPYEYQLHLPVKPSDVFL